MTLPLVPLTANQARPAVIKLASKRLVENDVGKEVGGTVGHEKEVARRAEKRHLDRGDSD